MARTSVIGVSCPVSQRKFCPLFLQYATTALLGEIGGFLDVRNARGARVAGNQADGERAFVEVPDFAAWSTDDKRSSFDFILVEGCAKI